MNDWVSKVNKIVNNYPLFFVYPFVRSTTLHFNFDRTADYTHYSLFKYRGFVSPLQLYVIN